MPLPRICALFYVTMQRIDAQHMQLHLERITKARETKTVDNDEPEHVSLRFCVAACSQP